jgi:serine/threonine protein kinase
VENSVFEFDGYHPVGLIGHGSQSEVNRYAHNTSGELIVVKSSPLRECDVIKGIVKKRILREVQSLMKFRHRCIVSLLGYDLQIESNILRIAMPYVGPDSLESVLESPQNHHWLTLTSKTIIIVGIVIGLYFVYCGSIIHRDLKPASVLLDPISHYPKIANFGWSRESDTNFTTTGLSLSPCIGLTVTATGLSGSPFYMAP